MGQSMTVYNMTNPGHEFQLFTNPANAFRDYDGFQLIGDQALLEQLAGAACPTPGRTRDGTVDNRGGTNAGGGGTQGLGQTGGFANPNHTINIDGDARFDPTHA